MWLSGVAQVVQTIVGAKNCTNPCGQRPLDGAPRRKRAKHEWRKINHMSSLEFALQKEEQLPIGPLTKLEFFVLDT